VGSTRAEAEAELLRPTRRRPQRAALFNVGGHVWGYALLKDLLQGTVLAPRVPLMYPSAFHNGVRALSAPYCPSALSAGAPPAGW
jgi:hypothetical protein